MLHLAKNSASKGFSFFRAMSSQAPLHRSPLLKTFSDRDTVALHAPLVRRDIKTEQLGGFKVTVVDNAPASEATVKTLWDSYVEVTYPLSSNMSTRAHFARPMIDNARFGRIFEVLDILAGEVSYRHVLGRYSPTSKFTLVTASIDGITFEEASIPVTEDLTFRAYLTNVGKSSMEVRTEIWSGRRYVGDGFFTFVCLDAATNKPVKVPELVASSPEDEPFLQRGASRSTLRKARLQESLERRPPNAEESALMHRIWRATNSVTGILQKPVEGSFRSALEAGPSADPSKEVFLYSLPAYAQHADGHLDWVNMRDTKTSSAQVMQPDHRNVHHKMFGGYLARKAFETSWVCAQNFFKTPLPIFSGVDNIFFREPVEVGTMVDNIARVVLSTPDEVQIQVDSIMRSQYTGKKTVANLYHFYYRPSTVWDPQMKDSHTFSTDRHNRPNLIVPYSYEEHLTYLDARRRYLQRKELIRSLKQ